MKISDLIEHLKSLQVEHGDLPLTPEDHRDPRDYVSPLEFLLVGYNQNHEKRLFVG